MSQYLPDVPELLKTVQGYIRELAAKSKGGDKYDALVAAYLLGICERELKNGPTIDAKEKEQLAKFLKSESSLEDLHKAICAGIRNGDLDGQWDELLDMLLTQTVANVSVVRPDHLDDMHQPGKQ